MTLVQRIMQRTQNYISFSRWFTLLITTSVLFWPVLTIAATPVEIEQWLQTHNNYRTLHGVSTVTWSKAVAASAQDYADTCPSGHSGSGYGENLAWASYNMGVSSVVQMWYNEESDYDYDNPGFSSETGHFTQVVWKATTEIGCAFATRCDSNWPYMANAWVCQYNPPGNFIGQFAKNVFPPNSGNEDDSDEGATPVNSGTIVSILHLLLLK